MFDSVDKDFKIAVIDVFKDCKVKTIWIKYDVMIHNRDKNFHIFFSYLKIIA